MCAIALKGNAVLAVIWNDLGNNNQHTWQSRPAFIGYICGDPFNLYQLCITLTTVLDIYSNLF